MAAEDTRQEVLDRVGATFCEFLEVAIHTILCVRGVYPAELFERKRPAIEHRFGHSKYNVPVQQSRHKDLNEYISNAVLDVRDWISRGGVEQVVLSVEEASSRRQIERFVFEVDIDLTGQPSNLPAGTSCAVVASSEEGLEDGLRQALLKITVVDSVLPRLSTKDVTFSVYVHARDSLDPTDHWEVLAGEEQWVGAPRAPGEAEGAAIVPLKTVRAGAFALQLYAQVPAVTA